MTAPDASGRADVGDGASVAYRVYGARCAGVPLLLIRPLGGTMALWGPFGDALALHRRVIEYDPRGAGASSPAAAAGTTRGLGRDALRVLDALGVEAADVFGISLGGMAAQWLALDAPSRLRRLCLASTTARGLDLIHAGARRGLAVAASFLEPPGHVEARLLLSLLTERFKRRNKARVEAIERPLLAEPASRLELLKHGIAGARHDLRARASEIRAPTLILAGEKDAFLGLAAQERLAKAIPGATFAVVAGAGHDITLEMPLVSASLVEQFLSKADDS